MPTQTWLEYLRNWLCQLYLEFGGNCGELGATASEQIATVADAYDTFDPPQSQWPAINADLDELASLEQSPINPLPTPTNDELKKLIIMIRAKVN